MKDVLIQLVLLTVPATLLLSGLVHPIVYICLGVHVACTVVTIVGEIARARA